LQSHPRIKKIKANSFFFEFWLFLKTQTLAKRKGKTESNSEFKSEKLEIPASVGQFSGEIKLAGHAVWFRENQTTQEQSFETCDRERKGEREKEGKEGREKVC